MRIRSLLAVSAVLFAMMPALASAASVTGALVSGGGLDDMAITIKNKKGEKIYMYCNSLCGDWFAPSSDEEGLLSLKKGMAGKKVRAIYEEEANGGRIVGPDGDERFYFLKRLEWLRN